MAPRPRVYHKWEKNRKPETPCAKCGGERRGSITHQSEGMPLCEKCFLALPGVILEEAPQNVWEER